MFFIKKLFSPIKFLRDRINGVTQENMEKSNSKIENSNTYKESYSQKINLNIVSKG